MKKYVLALAVIFVSLTGKALTKTDLAEELVYQDRAYTWFTTEYKRGFTKIYGKSIRIESIISAELSRHEEEIKNRLAKFYAEKLTKGELLALTMPLSLLKGKALAQIKQTRSTTNFLLENSDIAENIGAPLITQLDLHTWAGTDKIATIALHAAKTVSMN